jgi:hypothetical protein
MAADHADSKSHRALMRARRSLYGFPIRLSPESAFLFAGWLRLEQMAQAALERDGSVAATREAAAQDRLESENGRLSS